ncbi:MAG: polysaccharide biosynthesis protein, partial [Clostridia bacterium]|nr:polysaccharide biosynthesis protein [Clostridia bacterium]
MNKLKNTNKNITSTKKQPRYSIGRVQIIDLFMMLYDVAAVSLAFFIALWFRFDCKFSEIPRSYLMGWLKFVPIYAVISLAVFHMFHLYRSIWKFASFVELKRIFWATAILGVVHTVGITVLFERMPISYYIIGIAIQLFMITAVRFAYRFVLLDRSKSKRVTADRVMLIGGGCAGQMVLRDLQRSSNLNEMICCIIDDDAKKHSRDIEGVPIVGGREDILLNVEKYKINKIYLTMPATTAEQRRDILDICK